MDDNLSDAIPYIEAFKKALRQIDGKITEGQRKMLVGHYAAPNMSLSVKKLAELAGYVGDRSGSLQYGRLARKISEVTGAVLPPNNQISAIAGWSNVVDERGHGQWVLYDELAQALEELDWVKPSVQNKSTDDHDEFYERVVTSFNDLESDRQKRLAVADKKPKTIQVTSTVFVRNPDVVAEVLFRAKGICERCTSPAPFIRKVDSTPYLEVHHKIRLADGGLDCVENAIALCPNCHRKNHHGFPL